MVHLLADSSATGGRLSTQRVTLAGGADGARPHHHTRSAELFYVISGSAQLLAGERLVVAGEGDDSPAWRQARTGQQPVS
jgi:mannose-6-phosphate isomerase-like protein (cupin superfamily)